jgi:hypothetical protein
MEMCWSLRKGSLKQRSSMQGLLSPTCVFFLPDFSRYLRLPPASNWWCVCNGVRVVPSSLLAPARRKPMSVAP